ncbi:hypothetical protein ACFVH4_17835 [Nocardia ignorata]|uniref:hypothetical protein n=1 Tax=Nocardia ignorata TaxID=145285 RepID=UPI0036255E79
MSEEVSVVAAEPCAVVVSASPPLWLVPVSAAVLEPLPLPLPLPLSARLSVVLFGSELVRGVSRGSVKGCPAKSE